MIEPLSWEFRHEQEENPFRPGSSRPLKVTLHSSSFSGLTEQQSAALALIRELAPVGGIDVLDTDHNAPRHLKIGERKEGGDYLDLTVWENGECRLHSGISYPDQKLTTAFCVAGKNDVSDPRAQAAFNDLLVASAHWKLGRHLLITESPWLRHQHCRGQARQSNTRPILEATKIIGQFLRVRDKYVFRHERRSWFEPTEFSRSLFFWVLARHRTPAMWRYFSACVALEQAIGGATTAMGSSILTRCKHALEACDLIAAAFYAPGSDAASDATEYHFDYLALLLVGALDAQARIAHRVYRIAGDNRVNFRRPSFIKALADAGAEPLVQLFSDSHVKGLLTLLFEVRNTIHSASLGSHGHHTTGSGPGWLEIHEGDLWKTLWDAAGLTGGADCWGMKKFRHRIGTDGPMREPIRLVPYPYAAQLLRGGIDLVNSVAAATPIERLFGTSPIPALLEGPPDEVPFTSDIRNRIDLLA